MLAIEMLPANHGDCLWIEYGTPRDTRHVVIDGGPPYAGPALATRLEGAGGHVELLVVSHVDFDHVGGVISLLARPPAGTRIDEVWFNGWEQLPGAPGDVLGAVQGEMVSAAIRAHGLAWNARLGQQAVAVLDDGVLPSHTLEGGLRLTLLAPRLDALARLRPKWRDEVEEAGLVPGDFGQALARLRERERLPDDTLGDEEPDVERLAAKPFDEDRSLANWSSIALLAEYDGRSCLLAGDAPPGALVEGIDALCAERETDRLRIDAAKLAHHGSKGSTSTTLLERLECPRFLVSTNGRIFRHPSPETLARVILHGGEAPCLCFNYRSPNSLLFDSDPLRQRLHYQTVYPADDPKGLRVEL
jgi:hypothetical protein